MIEATFFGLVEDQSVGGKKQRRLAMSKKINLAILSAPEFNESLWINATDRLPDVKSGNCKEFIVHARSINGGNTYVFAAMYLNEMMLENSLTEEDEEHTGWHIAKPHYDYDEFYEYISSYEILHWMPLPLAPEEI